MFYIIGVPLNRELNNANNDVFTYNAEKMVNHYRSISVNQNILSNEYLHSINLTHKIVSDAIKNSKNNKSPGVDGITNELLKNGGDCLTDSMFIIFSKILDDNVIQIEWNNGVIIPIFKKGDHKDMNNYLWLCSMGTK